MIQSSSRALARMAAIGALVAALGVAGCGRKGGLDLPPAAATSDATAAPGDTIGTNSKQGSALGPDGKPIAPRTGPKTPTILDWLVE